MDSRKRNFLIGFASRCVDVLGGGDSLKKTVCVSLQCIFQHRPQSTLHPNYIMVGISCLIYGKQGSSFSEYV